MNARLFTMVGALALGLVACPPATTTPDGGDDGGTIQNPDGPCTGGCAVNQKCDVDTHQCVDGCGGCDGGLCVRNASGDFQCLARTTSCGGNLCAEGQLACVAGACSCLPFSRVAEDTCAPQGAICNGTYNLAIAAGGTCDPPKQYEACRTEGCGTGGCAACPAGMACDDVFGSGDGCSQTADCPSGEECVGGRCIYGLLCLKTCAANNECTPNELCSQIGCLPRTLFAPQEADLPLGASYKCFRRVQLDPPADAGTAPDGGPFDAGFKNIQVVVGNPCVTTDENGVPQGIVPTGNCTYDFMRFTDELMTFSSCHRPGDAGVNAPCKRDTSAATIAQQCGTGLECALTRGDTGQCLKMCNAILPLGGHTPQPSCEANESCVNIHRLEDTVSVVGVCMKGCDVFSTTGSVCADYGSVKASCVPVPADGQLPVSPDGTGVCVPQKATVANAGEPCTETDPYKGAACASGLLCRSASELVAPICMQPCDVSCAIASPPARCATQPNANCSGGKTCTRVTATTGATLGFCM